MHLPVESIVVHFPYHPMRRPLLAFAAVCILAACKPASGPNNTATPPQASPIGVASSRPSMPTLEERQNAHGVYTAFSPDVIGNGKRSLLFFHAAWCPICKVGDAKMQQWYSDNNYTINTYKVDYDTSAELKQRYGVTYQHTFVLIDGQGNAEKVMQGPTDLELQSVLFSG